jgi:tRNA 2-(methylsulfanyl)-N6-isopentenyladenosine37 hydroxylase
MMETLAQKDTIQKEVQKKHHALPLVVATPRSWAESVLAEPLLLLADHAYLERKAASNALDLINRWSSTEHSEYWVLTLAGIAKDETAHLHTVARLLAKRGGTLARVHKNYYANDLRGLVRIGQGNLDVMDRLLVSALIEVRSCERFLLLAEVSLDAELKNLYDGLFASEAGHYKTFLKLAESVASPETVRTRWQAMLKQESEIIQRQPKGAFLHSGF